MDANLGPPLMSAGVGGVAWRLCVHHVSFSLLSSSRCNLRGDYELALREPAVDDVRSSTVCAKGRSCGGRKQAKTLAGAVTCKVRLTALLWSCFLACVSKLKALGFNRPPVLDLFHAA